MNRMATILFSLTLLLWPNLALADTVITSQITSDTTWSPAGGVYIVDSNFIVVSGVTLTLEPGTIVKGKFTSANRPSIFGRLVAYGTAEAPIYFTSIYDDSVGGDSDGTGPTDGRLGIWQGLYFQPDSEGDLDHVNFSYGGAGGYGYGDFVGIKNDGGTLNINNSRFSNNYQNSFDWSIGSYRSGFTIFNKGTLSIKNSIIAESGFGIYSETGTTTIENSVIENNTHTGFLAGESLDPVTLINNKFIGNKKTASVSGMRLFTHSGNTSEDLGYRGFEMTGYTRDGAVLHSRDLPIIRGPYVQPGVTVNIEPGTVIKISQDGRTGIYVYGKLNAIGTPDEKIYFTSLADDSLMGDTNGDGDISSPGIRNWNAIFLEDGSEANFENVVMRYGGFNFNGEYMPGVASSIYARDTKLSIKNSIIDDWSTAIFQDAGTVNITDSKLVSANYGIYFRGGEFTISNSDLSLNSGIAMFNQSGSYPNTSVKVIDARNNWWGDPSGPWDASTSTPTGNGVRMDGSNILYSPWLGTPPTDSKKTNPVIVIPGIMGSAYKNGDLVIDPILHTYDDLITTLLANGYEAEKTLFTFSYEWRNSNVTSANLLKDKISFVKSACSVLNIPNTDCSKVDLVAHSMGGLVARQYIQSASYTNDVDQLIFLGTPHQGSPKAYLQWEAGQNDTDFQSMLTQLFFQAEAFRNGYSTIFDYIRGYPITSVKELLPITNYLKDDDVGIIRFYPNDYPSNIFLERLSGSISDLLNSGVQITNIYGNSGSDTIKIIRVVPTTHSQWWEHGEPDRFGAVIGDNGLERGEGDDTVTLTGATLNSSVVSKEFDATHQELPTIAEGEVVKILTGKSATIIIDNNHNLSKKILLMQLLSPVDFVVTDPQGRKIGKNFSSGTEYNNIPYAFYSGFQTDNEYITILNPLDGEYKIELQGTGNGGEYTILTSAISEDVSTTTKIVGVTLPNQMTSVNVFVDNNNFASISSEKEVTLGVLLNDIKVSYSLGWIKDAKTRDYLLSQAQKVIKFDKRSGTIKVDKELAKLLIKDLDKFLKSKNITLNAYNLLKTDLEWLINN